MENIEQQSPHGCPKNEAVSIHNGVCVQHLARPDVPVQVRARRLCEHEVLQKWSERTLFVNPVIYDVQGLCVLARMQGQLCNCHDTRTHRHWSRHTATCCSVFVGLHVIQVDGRPLPRPVSRVLAGSSTVSCLSRLSR